MSSLQIGDVCLDNNIVLAPMAGVTDLPFRLLCKEQGAGLLCMEMVSAKAISYKNKATEEMMEIHPEEKPVSLQLFGCEPDLMAEVARTIEERPFAILDINMGCPVPKVVNNGEGSALMKNPKLVEEILYKTVRAIKKPVTIKIRKGFNEESVNAVEIAKIAEQCGAAAVTVHGRTREEYYSGHADWDIIRQVKESVSIPVIGNGDVTDAASAKRMLAETGCDGIAIGRAARGNPWIFREIRWALENTDGNEGKCETTPDGNEGKCGAITDGNVAKWNARPSTQEIKDMILRHARLQVQYKSEYTAMREMRKHVAWYTQGLPHSAAMRRRVNEVNTIEELEELLAGLF